MHAAIHYQRLPRHPEGLIDIALGKPAAQSSISPWSREGEASEAVSGIDPHEWSFHTDREHKPWWELDLQSAYPIEAVIVHNRRNGFQDRAQTLRIEVSEDRTEWILLHAGRTRFGARGDGTPLEMWPSSQVEARYLRLSLDEHEYLHLSRVEVLARPDLMHFSAYCHRFSLPRYYFNESPTSAQYTLEWSSGTQSFEIVGLKINYSGRFGNLLHQYINTIELAKRTGLRFIQLGRHELLNVKAEFEAGGITFLPADADLPPDGTFIAGEFFNSDDFVPVLSPFLQFRPEDESECTSIVQEYIVPHMLTGIPLPDEQHPDDELTIHIRAGDVFNSDHPVTFGYRQPPLAFYVMVVNKMRLARRIERVRLVFEDRGNPCIDALEQWLLEKKISYRITSGSLHQDMSALIDAPHLVFGHGTFGYAACRLSKRIETVHFFAPELGGSYAYIPTIQEVYEVTDREGGYIKAFEYGRPFGPDDGWRNTPQMRERMLTYPIEHLDMATLTSRQRHVIRDPD